MLGFESGLRGWFLGLLLSLCACPASAQAAPPSSIVTAFAVLAQRAATVFVGQVIGIQHQGSVVLVCFRIDQPIAGTSANQYELREWAGLWPSGQIRYFVGERALVFLHEAASSGLATPVNGGEGVVPVLVQGVQAAPLLDIRRLASSVLRTVGEPLPDETQGAIELPTAVAIVRSALATGNTNLHVKLISRPLPGAGVERRPVVSLDSQRPDAARLRSGDFDLARGDQPSRGEVLDDQR